MYKRQIKDTADAVSKSSVEILGDSDSVTLSDVANAAQGALINALDKGEDSTNITFNVKDTAANLAAKATNLDVANVVTVGDSASTELNVANAGLLNGITNYDHQGGYTIKDTADAVSKSSVAILGDSDSVTLSDVANAAQGALINGFDKGESTTDITFSVKDTAANLAANAANLDVANAVTIGDSASTELNVANAGLLNGIPNYDNKGAYTIRDTADAVSKSSVEILGDAVSVTLSDVANAAQGALINGLDKGESTTDITFNVEDSATNLAAKAANLDVAEKVSVGSAGDNEVSVADAGLLNGIANYDHQGGYTIKDTADAVSKSSVAILGDADSVTLSDVANAAQGRSSMGSIRARAPRISHLT